MPFLLRFTAALAAASLLLVSASTARADASEDEGGDTCSMDDECPETGVECDESLNDFASCVEDAEARGLVVACTGTRWHTPPGADEEVEQEYRVYCDPEEGGCGVRAGGRTPTIPIAAGVFAVAAAATVVRHRRRHRG